MATLDDELECRRLDYENMFLVIDDYMRRHPEIEDPKEAWDAVTLYNIDKQAAILASIEEHRP